MCSHYQALKESEKFRKVFGVEPPPESGKLDMWPGYVGNFIRRHPHADVGDEAVPAAEALNGLFGLVPHWSQDTKITRSTYNARSETVAEKPSFRDVWKRGQRCIIPADAIFEPDWRSGKAVPAKIMRADGDPMGIAGLWASWKSPKGDYVLSFTMLTINADAHGLMRQFHKPSQTQKSTLRMQIIRTRSVLCVVALARRFRGFSRGMFPPRSHYLYERFWRYMGRATSPVRVNFVRFRVNTSP